MPEGPGRDEDEKPPRPSVATRDGQRVSDNGDGLFSIETCNDEYAHGVLRHAITHTHVTSSQGHALLVMEIVPGLSLGNISKRTCVIRVKATTASQTGGIVLVPFGGGIVGLSPGEKKTAYKMLNPSTIPTVPAKVTTAPEQPTPGCLVPKQPRSRKFAIVSPLVEFNQTERKADDDDGEARLLTIASFWAVLHAPGEKNSMKLITKTTEDGGFIGPELPKIRTKGRRLNWRSSSSRTRRQSRRATSCCCPRLIECVT